MAKQFPVTYNGSDRWLLPLNLAIGLHLLIAFSVVFVPALLKNKPKFEDIVSVDLVSLGEPPAPQAPPAVKPAPPPPVPKAEPAKPEPEAVNLKPEPEVAPPPEKPVSLKPLKKKIKKQVKETPPPPNRDVERVKRQNLAEALRAEQQAAEEAKRAAEDAARQQQLLERQLAAIKRQSGSTTSAPSRSTGSSSSTLSILEKQYYAAIINRISQFWALPEFKKWNPSTQAIVVITVAQNGAVVKQFFEQRSDDPTFDQFVRKTLQDAAPLPAIPPALRMNSFEIGLRFSPGNIQ